MEIFGRSLLSIKKLIAEKKTSSAEVFEFFLQRIKKYDPKINAFIQTAEKPVKENQDFLPISVKDNFCTKGIRTTAGSKILDNFIPSYDSTVVKKLKKANLKILGKTNMDAWAHGSSTETSDFGPTRNPWNLDYTPGGSSGGSAAAVSAYLSPASIGSETAGSVRQPAAWCGVLGLKPTYGRISRFGLIAMASSFDCPSIIALDTKDCAYLLQILSGKDNLDATSAQKSPANYFENLEKKERFRIGVPEEYFEDVQAEIRESFEKVRQILEKFGFRFKKIKLIPPDYAISVYTIIQRAEVASNLARYDGIRYGRSRRFFGTEAKKRIMLGNFVLSAGYYQAYYLQAQKVRDRIKLDFEDIFKDIDLILSPVVPSTALKLGEFEKYPFFGELIDKFNEPAAIAGVPAISFPVGIDKKGLPLSLQFIADYFQEAKLLNAVYQLQQETNFFEVIQKGLEKWR